MTQDPPSILKRLNPAVPRRYLFATTGALWTLAGGALCLRAEIWLEIFPLGTEIALGMLSTLLAAAAYFFLFVKVVEKNIHRIGQLPERACIFAFTAWSGYALIAFMIVMGMSARSTTIPKYLLAVPSITMGIMLIFGSLRFFREFLATRPE